MAVTASHGPTRSRRVTVCAIICAAMIVMMLLAQLFGYEDFASVLSVLLPFNDQPLINLSAAVIVIAELLALPYLLGMYLSPLMRFFSVVVCGAVSGFWLLTSLTNAHASNSGLFSTTLNVPGGIMAAVWSLLLISLYFIVAVSDSRFRHDTSLEVNGDVR